jgi:hypothetical protein
MDFGDLVAGMVDRVAQLVDGDIEDAAPVSDIGGAREVDALAGRVLRGMLHAGSFQRL